MDCTYPRRRQVYRAIETRGKKQKARGKKQRLWAQKSVLENLIPVSPNVYLLYNAYSNPYDRYEGATINTRHRFELPD